MVVFAAISCGLICLSSCFCKRCFSQPWLMVPIYKRNVVCSSSTGESEWYWGPCGKLITGESIHRKSPIGFKDLFSDPDSTTNWRSFEFSRQIEDYPDLRLGSQKPPTEQRTVFENDHRSSTVWEDLATFSLPQNCFSHTQNKEREETVKKQP